MLHAETDTETETEMPATSPETAGVPQTLPLQDLVNRVNRGLMRTPLIASAMGRKLLVLYVVGRKTGKRYAIPTAYAEHDGALLIGTSFAWVHNLRTGEPVQIRLKRKLRTADVEVFTDEEQVVGLYTVITRNNHAFAGFNRIAMDPNGEPNPADLAKAWAAGARAIKLTLR